MDLADRIYVATRSFPREEIYGLTAQLRRSVISVPSNIAEGFNRRNNTEYRQFLFIALGSLGELETQIRLADRQNLLKKEAEGLLRDVIILQRMTRALADRIGQHLLLGTGNRGPGTP